jgi:hypothetical protein
MLSFPSVVVGDLHLMCAVFSPNETNAELVIDANAVLPIPVAFQWFQPVAGRASQFVEVHHRLNPKQLSDGYRLNRCPTSIRSGFKEFLCIGVFEALNHPQQA